MASRLSRLVLRSVQIRGSPFRGIQQFFLPNYIAAPTAPFHQNSVRHFCVKPIDANRNAIITCEEEISTKDTLDHAKPSLSGKMYIEFTCKKCEHRSQKYFSKQAYEKGIVIIRCDGCENLHLIADNLGWIKDGGRWRLEDVVKVKMKSLCVA